MNCRIGLIAWPIKSKDFHLFLGEIYDKNMKNILSLQSLYQDLNFLTPCRGIPNYTLEKELCFIREKYKITTQSKIITKTNIPSSCIFKIPQIYDISCMVPIFSFKINRPIYICKSNISIIFPYENPIIRGKIIYEIIDKSNLILITGSIKIIEQTVRLLKLCKVPKEKILTLPCSKDNCINESISMLNFLHLSCSLNIACAKEDINFAKSTMKKYNKQKTRYFVY